MTIAEISVSNEELRVMLETGFILREAAKFEQAETVFRGVMEFLPDSDVPPVGLSTVYLQKGDFQSAEEICETVLETNPQSLYARVHRAEAMLFSRRREEAESELREIISENPDSPHSQTARALLEAADLISPD
jgi:Tfp pilus assembly protein PilF